MIHEQGLVSVLKQIHDDLDAAVFEAYGWPVTLTDEEILERLVALNAERAAEEQRGLIRWLRPEFQNPSGGKTIQPELDIEPEEEEEVAATGKKAKRGAKPQAGGRPGRKVRGRRSCPSSFRWWCNVCKPPQNRSPPPTWPRRSPKRKKRTLPSYWKRS